MRLMTQNDVNTFETHDQFADLLNSVADAIRQVIPVPVGLQSPELLEGSVFQNEIGVLVGFTGDIYGRIVLQSSEPAFRKMGEMMFGMPLEGELLHSFIGELANMIAGNTSTILFNKGHEIDITPPTVMVGKLHLYGFDSGISVPVELGNIGDMKIILTIQKQGVA
jgi:chemotaxis protein CheX